MTVTITITTIIIVSIISMYIITIIYVLEHALDRVGLRGVLGGA